MSTRGKYSDYTIRFGESRRRCEITESLSGSLMKVTHTLNRIPSTREFLVWHRIDATPEERTRTEQANFARRFATIESHPDRLVARLKINDRGTKPIAFQFFSGDPIDDPLIQLELEMMIDIGSEVKN